MPGKIIQCLKKTKTENPLILIDEVMYLIFLLVFSHVSTLDLNRKSEAATLPRIPALGL